MSNMILYHGSPEIVRKPEYGKGKPYNDYGRGFYCTENLDCGWPQKLDTLNKCKAACTLIERKGSPDEENV